MFYKEVTSTKGLPSIDDTGIPPRGWRLHDLTDIPLPRFVEFQLCIASRQDYLKKSPSNAPESDRRYKDDVPGRSRPGVERLQDAKKVASQYVTKVRTAIYLKVWKFEPFSRLAPDLGLLRCHIHSV
jgi:hypothetical protein